MYKDVKGASTQWDDIQRKLGNLPLKAYVFKPDPFTPAEDEDSRPKDKPWIDHKTEEELEDLEDDLDDDCFLQEYRFCRKNGRAHKTRETQNYDLHLLKLWPP
nr:phosducin-like protein 3 [Tanacetum cinerariifolium]